MATFVWPACALTTSLTSPLWSRADSPRMPPSPPPTPQYSYPKGPEILLYFLLYILDAPLPISFHALLTPPPFIMSTLEFRWTGDQQPTNAHQFSHPSTIAPLLGLWTSPSRGAVGPLYHP